MYILGKDVSLDKVAISSMKALVGNYFYIEMEKKQAQMVDLGCLEAEGWLFPSV
jgi:hypothetical protein